jgi:hypothetical protein
MSPRPTVTKVELVAHSDELFAPINHLESQIDHLRADVDAAVQVTMTAIEMGNFSATLDVETHRNNCQNYKILKHLASVLADAANQAERTHSNLNDVAASVFSLVG